MNILLHVYPPFHFLMALLALHIPVDNSIFLIYIWIIFTPSPTQNTYAWSLFNHVQLFATAWNVACLCPVFCPASACRLLCPWDFQGKNTGVGWLALLQGGGFPTQGLILCLIMSPEPAGRLFTTSATGIRIFKMCYWKKQNKMCYWFVNPKKTGG